MAGGVSPDGTADPGPISRQLRPPSVGPRLWGSSSVTQRPLVRFLWCFTPTLVRLDPYESDRLHTDTVDLSHILLLAVHGVCTLIIVLVNHRLFLTVFSN